MEAPKHLPTIQAEANKGREPADSFLRRTTSLTSPNVRSPSPVIRPTFGDMAAAAGKANYSKGFRSFE